MAIGTHRLWARQSRRPSINLERQSSVQVLSRLAVECAVVSLGRRPLLRPGSGRRSTRDLRAQVGGVPRLADRRLLDRPARAAVELGDSPRGRDARGPGAIQRPAFPRSSSASARRATARDSAYFLDLGDPSGRAVAIRDQGWHVVDRPGVHFRRPEGLLAAAGAGSRRLDRSVAPVRQPHRAGFPPDDRLADGGAAAGRALSDPGLERRTGVGQEHAGQDPAPSDRPAGLPRPGPPQQHAQPDGHRCQRLAARVREYQHDPRLVLRLRLPARVRRGLRQPHALHERRTERHLRPAAGDPGWGR